MKKLVFFYLYFILIPAVLGLQCPTCTYITTDASIPSMVRSIMDRILNLFQDPECAQNLKGPIPEINEETCEEITGKVSRCSYYKGRIDLKIPLLVTEVDVPIQIHQRGCYHSKPANVPAIGCHKREDINEDSTFIKQLLNKASDTFESYEVANFEGDMCLCVDTYCKKTSGASMGAVISPVLSLMVFAASRILSM